MTLLSPPHRHLYPAFTDGQPYLGSFSRLISLLRIVGARYERRFFRFGSSARGSLHTLRICGDVLGYDDGVDAYVSSLHVHGAVMVNETICYLT